MITDGEGGDETEPEMHGETRIDTMQVFLRDQMAAAALTGLLASGNLSALLMVRDLKIPALAYAYADMMLEERERRRADGLA